METAYTTTQQNKENFGSKTGKASYLDNTIAAQQQQIDIFTKILVGGELEVSLKLGYTVQDWVRPWFHPNHDYARFFKKMDNADNATDEEEDDLVVPKQPPPRHVCI